MFVLERLADAKARRARIYGEVAGYAMNSDAARLRAARSRAAGRVHGVGPAAGRPERLGHRHREHARHGHQQRRRPGGRRAAAGVRHGDGGGRTLLNNTKSFIGHAMGAAGALELAGNLPAFDDGVCHATINLDRVDHDAPCRGWSPTSRGK